MPAAPRTARIARLGIAACALSLWASPARAGQVPAELGGHLVVATSSIVGADDGRLGLIAAGLAKRGFESFVAYDMGRPPSDAERLLVRGRWLLDDARRLRRRDNPVPAERAADQAVKAFERAVSEQQDLSLLVEALVERGAAAVDLNDSATAETVFLKAIALNPDYELDPQLYPDDVIQLYQEVSRVSRQLQYGALRIDPGGITEPVVSVDFGAPKEPPYEAKLSDGRHYVSVSGPGRHEVVTGVTIRSERQTTVTLRPPMAGDQGAREVALAAFRPGDPASLAALAASAGLRFVLLVDIGRSNLSLRSYDGKSGAPLPGAEATLSVNPSEAEIDAAIGPLLSAALAAEPKIAEAEEPDEGTPIWPFALIGLGVIGGGVAAVFLITSAGAHDYRFEP